MPVPIEKSAIARNNQCRKSYPTMNKVSKRRGIQDAIPPTAKAIKINNVQNPYIMKAYEMEKYQEVLCAIQEKLFNFMKTDDFLKNKNEAEVKIGDMVFVQRSDVEIKLPSYVYRGLITYIKKETGTYYIFLVDHGVSIELTRHHFYLLPQDFIRHKYLTKTVGVYGILPIRMNGSILNGRNTKAVVVEKWTGEACQFTNRLLSESEIIYFDHLDTDESNGREYGDFYCIIGDDVISLSETLFLNYHAIYIEGELLKLVETYTKLKEKRWYILYVKYLKDKEKRKNAITRNELNNSYTTFNLSEKILVQSSIDYDVYNEITELRYPKKIHQGWDDYIKSSRPRKLQSYIWPAINNGLNVVAIGASQCGKTSGCVMAVCGQIAMLQHEIHKATKPLALILCASSYEVICVHAMCESFLRSINSIKSVAAFNGKSIRSVAALIYSGCQILVTTPRYLARFLKESKGLLSFDRLSILVLDNADVILDKYYHSIAELFAKYKIIENRDPQANDRPLLQIIISATEWTVRMKTFVQLVMSNPYICIASFMEAVAFKSVFPTIHIWHSDYKKEKLLELLKDNNYITMKTAIVCLNAQEAEELNTFLILTKKTLLIHENMKSFDIRALRQSWTTSVCGSYPLLICADPVLSDLTFTDVQWLIHYSIFSQFKTQFSYRFSLLLNNLVQDATNCKINIIFDETNNLQFPSIVRFLQRMDPEIRPDIIHNMKQITITLERNKKEYAICDNVKSFGFCEEKNVCEFRHCVLPGVDKPMTSITINDTVKLMVLYVHDTTHFSARIIEHTSNSKSKKTTYSNVEYMRTTAKIQSYYGKIENRKMCTSTNVGDICVLEETIDTFKRVQIRRIRNDKDCSEKEKFVDVRCIDSGIIHECIDVRKLIHIPEELLNLPTHVVEIFLAELAPLDEEYKWNHFTNEQVHKWFSENFDDRSYIIGKVCLHLGNTIWLDDLRIGTKLIGHPDLIGASLKKQLLLGNFAVFTTKHLSRLSQLCKDSGILKQLC